MDPYTRQEGYGSRPMATASLVTGILSLALFVTGLSLFIGALAVILAILSRGSGRMLSGAVTGLITGITGIGLSLLLLISAVLMISDGEWKQYMDEIEKIYQEYSSQENSPLASPLITTGKYSDWTCHLTEQEFSL